mmetsp:Transcript_79356/g.202081  ORF Transcript_79356/g.202081 Transcript_79356/m.202081 type:complete len:237 (+) Transcript_79356:211-921(+)
MQPPTKAAYCETAFSFLRAGQSLQSSTAARKFLHLLGWFLTMQLWYWIGKSGTQEVALPVHCAGGAGAGGAPFFGAPMAATCPGSKRIFATHPVRLFWKFAQEASQSLAPCPIISKKLFLPPSGPVVAGHFPHTSLQSAGFHADLTAAASPAGDAPVLMQANQFLHQGWISFFPLFESVHKTSVGSYAVRSGVSSTAGRRREVASQLVASNRDEMRAARRTIARYALSSLGTDRLN